jgi:trigger factor
MSSSYEKVEANKIKMTVKVEPAEFKRGLQFAYDRNKHRMNIQGFRKGKAPRKMIERLYGKDIFYDEALNHILPDIFEAAIEENNLEPVYRPEIDVESMDEAEGAVFLAEFFIKPEVEISDYYGLTYPIIETEPTEEEVEDYIQSEREKNSRTVTVDRPSEIGDIITINFTGYVDDEPFEGGHAEDYELTLGSKTFIDTFEEQLVGHVAGDDIDVNVTFPEDYGKEDLSGKPALFKVEVLEVQAKEMPEIDDNFAQDVSDFDTLEEYKQDIIKQLREENEKEALYAKRAAIVEKLVEKAVMDVPEVMYTARVEEMTTEMRYTLMRRGLDLERYLQFSGMTLEDMQEGYQKPAKEEVDGRLVLEAVAIKEGFEVSDEEFEEQIRKMTPDEEQAKKMLSDINKDYKKDVINNILTQKALDFVVDKAVGMEEI